MAVRCDGRKVLCSFNTGGTALRRLVLLVWTGEMGPAVRHTLQNPEVLGLMVVSATMGYASIAFVLHLIAQFGATNTEIVKSLRKVGHEAIIITTNISFIYGHH
jgi:adenosine 3'-phospho 5'-phosphosulfate transporter B3